MPRYVAIGTTVSPYLDVYNWSSGFGSRFSNPSATPLGSNNSVRFLGSDYIGLSTGVSTATPWVDIYSFSSSGIGSRLSNSSNLWLAQTNSVEWHPNGNYIASVSLTSPYIAVYN